MKKTVEEYEAEARWEGRCFVLPIKNATDASRACRRIYKLRHPYLDMTGLFVCHRCDNPWCILDKHHFLGTPKDNSQDASRKGRMKWTDEHRQKTSQALKGRVFSDETRTKMSIAAKNCSEETKQRRSELAKNRTPEHRAKLSAALKNPSKETKEKQRAARAGWKMPEEGKKKISKALRGRKHTAEHRAKITASRRINKQK